MKNKYTAKVAFDIIKPGDVLEQCGDRYCITKGSKTLALPKRYVEDSEEFELIQ